MSDLKQGLLHRMPTEVYWLLSLLLVFVTLFFICLLIHQIYIERNDVDLWGMRFNISAKDELLVSPEKMNSKTTTSNNEPQNVLMEISSNKELQGALDEGYAIGDLYRKTMQLIENKDIQGARSKFQFLADQISDFDGLQSDMKEEALRIGDIREELFVEEVKKWERHLRGKLYVTVIKLSD